MSANIKWSPIEDGVSLDVSAPSSFLRILSEAFGHESPWMLEGKHLDILNGIKAGVGDKDMKQAINDICDAILKHNVIRVYAEY
jgi:hypothetical protein